MAETDVALTICGSWLRSTDKMRALKRKQLTDYRRSGFQHFQFCKRLAYWHKSKGKSFAYEKYGQENWYGGLSHRQ